MNTKHVIYVSSVNGSDYNDGSIYFPYKSLAKVLLALKNSTTILFERGSVFSNETLDLSGFNHIEVDTYGTGDLPHIDGFKAVIGWTNEGGNIWRHQDNNFPEEITNLLSNGVKLSIGKKAASTSTAGSTNTITDSSLTDPDNYWVGAELVLNYWDWSRGISRVTSYANKQFYFVQNESIYDAKAGMSYWIQNHRACLTVQNTWAYNNLNKTLYIYSTTEPSNITASYGSDCIYAVGAKYLFLSNININGARQCGINMSDCSRVTFNNVNLNYSGVYSFFFVRINGLKIINCVGLKQNNDFMNIWLCTNILIEDNRGIECGVDAGNQRYMNVPGPGGSTGLTIMHCKNTVMRFNEVGWTGYSGIGINYSNRFYLEGNWSHHFNLNKWDGGGLYMVHAGRLFYQQNFIYPLTTGRCLRNFVTDGNPVQKSYGIYPDNGSQDIEIAYNFVSGTKNNLMLHDIKLLNVHDNISLIDSLNSESGIYVSLQSFDDLRNIVNNNTIVAKVPYIPAIWVGYYDYPQTFKNNKYFYPFGKQAHYVDTKLIRIGNWYYTLAEWLADQSRINWDRTGEVELEPSLLDTGLIPSNEVVKHFINTSKVNLQIEESDLPYDDYVDLTGEDPSYPVTILPHEALVLTRAPKPEFSYAEVTAGTPSEIKVYMTIKLDETIVPDSGVFSLVDKSVTNLSISGNIITLTSDTDFETGDDMTISYTKPASNPLTSKFAGREVDSFSDIIGPVVLTLTARNTGLGVAYMRLSSTLDINLTLDGNGYFCDSLGGNQTQSAVCVGGSFWRDFYVICTSGISNLTFDKIAYLVQWRSWVTSNVNCPSLGGDLSKAVNLNYVSITGAQTITACVDKMVNLTVLSASTGFYGNLEKLTLVGLCTGSMNLTFDRLINNKGLFQFALSLTVFTEAQVNQGLADILANKDEPKDATYVTRNIDFTGAVGSAAPSGQGLLDKATLQAYRSPLNGSGYNLWTIGTR